MADTTHKLYRVTLERTYEADFVVVAGDEKEARRLALEQCDPEDQGDYDTFASFTDEVLDAKGLPEGLCPEDCVDAKPSTMKGHRYIREFLPAHPEETPEERECRLHNEAMLKRNLSLFPEVSRG